MGYQKRKRANKYEEKLKIDGTFEDAMKALLGVHPKQQNMIKIAEPKHFKFRGYSTLEKELSKDEIIKLGLESFCIRIEKIDPSQPIVNAEIVVDEKTGKPTKLNLLTIACFPVELNEKNEIVSPSKGIDIRGGIANFRTEPKATSITATDTFDFSAVKYNFAFECNALLFYAKPIDHDVTVLFSCFKQA